MNTGLTLKLKRVEAGLRQFEVAAEAGMTQSRLYLIENGRAVPSEDEIGRIEQAIQRGGSRMLEVEEQILAGMCGLSEQEFLSATFKGNLVSYKNFALARKDLRQRGHHVPPVILSDTDWASMKVLGTTPEGWLMVKYLDAQTKIKGLHDAEKIDVQLKASMAADAKQRRENEKREQARRELRKRE